MSNNRFYFICILILLMQTGVGIAASWPQITFVKVAGELNRPIYMTHADDNSERLFVVEQPGRIKIIQNNRLLQTPFLDISRRVAFGGERGLLSIAFPPQFSDKKYFYVNYTNISGNTTISRFYLGADNNIANAESEEIILTVEQPFGNHNGGQLAFGPDNYLYIGMGDGGGAGDPANVGQDSISLLGKMLRIDVEAGEKPYAIPKTNPFAINPSYRPEIWALGLRNPWRFSFDQQTGDLYIADVGQDKFEEINIQFTSSKGGENYGWKVMEGFDCFEQTTCDKTGLTQPILHYGRDRGDVSVTGGYVYRGQLFPRMQNIYFFGDFASGRVAGIRKVNQQWEASILADTDFSISSFGEDTKGQLYLTDLTGDLYRLEDNFKQSQIEFVGLLPEYQPGDNFQIIVREINPERELAIDLWVAVQTPDGSLLFFTGNLAQPLSSQPQSFKRNLDSSNNRHQVIDLLIPDEFATGSYTFYAVYNELNSELTETSTSGWSNVAKAIVELNN